MVQIKDWLLNRFPKDHHSINELWGAGESFEAKTREFYDVEQRLARLNPDTEPSEPGEVERLRSRRAALESELIRFMGANRR